MTERKMQILKFGVFLALLLIVYQGAKTSGLLETVTVSWIQNQVEAAGPWGVLAYLAIFCGGVLLYIPGVVFIVSGLLGFGWMVGMPLALLGSILSGTLSVWFLQKVGGNMLEQVEQPWVKRFVNQLHRQPIRSIAALRTIFWVSPPINTTLALSGIRLRENILGTTLGMIGPIIFCAISLETLLHYLES